MKLRSQASELDVLRRRAHLNFIAIDSEEVNVALSNRIMELADRLVLYLIDRNREFNKESVVVARGGLLL